MPKFIYTALLYPLMLVFGSLPLSAQTPVALAPNMVNVCAEGGTITAMPVGTVYQFGIGKTYTPAATSTATSPKVPFSTYYTTFPFDPAPGIVKAFWVQQQAKAYTVTCLLAGTVAQVVMPIPALPVVTPTAITIPFNGTCTTSIDPATNTLTINLSTAKAATP